MSGFGPYARRRPRDSHSRPATGRNGCHRLAPGSACLGRLPKACLPVVCIVFLSVQCCLAADFPRWREPVTGLDFVFVPGGCFSMGSEAPEAFPDQRPVHQVCLDDFFMGVTEVTVGAFARFVEDTGYRTEAERDGGCMVRRGAGWRQRKEADWRAPGYPVRDDLPVSCVSWHDAAAFGRWLTAVGGGRAVFRLPTEAEWEYAARSGGRDMMFAGGVDAASVAWYGRDRPGGGPMPVAAKQANLFGLFDMSGNVYEWVRDWYSADYYAQSPVANPPGPAMGRRRVERGGAWTSFAAQCRVGYRNGFSPSRRASYLGFRLVVTGLSGPAIGR